MASPATGRLQCHTRRIRQTAWTDRRADRPTASDELSAFNAAVATSSSTNVNPHALGVQLGEVLVDARGLGWRLSPKGQPGASCPFTA